MGRKVKSHRDTTPKDIEIFRPSSSGWQKWGVVSDIWSLQGEGAELSDLNPGEGGLIAVPARRTFSLALWIPAENPEVFQDLILTQLEMRGLAGRLRDNTTFAWQEIVREGNEILVHATILPANLAPRYWHGDVTDYAVSASFLPLDSDAITIWREQGGWVTAVTRSGKLVHFQSLATPDPGPAMALEVLMMQAALEAGNMIGENLPIICYRQTGDILDLAEWNKSTQTPIELREFPPPIRPETPPGCMPLAVRDLQAQKAKNARLHRLAFAVIAAYLLLVFLLAGRTFWLHWQAQQRQAAINRDVPAVAATQETMDKWQALLPALEPSTYPLEILYQTSRLLPKEGVRLTLFETSLDRVLIQGEASTLAAALKFQDDLKKNADLAALYDWSAEGPKQLPNGSTRFQIDGTRRGSSTTQSDESSDI